MIHNDIIASMLKKIVITDPTEKDWKILQEMNYQVYLNDKENDDDLDLDRPFSKSGVDYYKKLAKGLYGKCFIASMDGKQAGYIALSIKDFGYRKSKYVEIENIGVQPEYRSCGIGKLLMKTAEKWAKRQGATKLFVSAYWGNKKAIKFYKTYGFYETGIELDKKID